jgi:Leucine-rich repeat (LRR) protein
VILEGRQVTDLGIRNIRGPNELRILQISDSEVTDAGLEDIGRFTSLTNLNVSSDKITDAGINHLHSLKNLESLSLRGPRIRGEGLAAVAANVRWLELSGTSVTDEGLPHLSRIEMLNLVDTKITDAVAVKLAQMSTLRHLYVSGTSLTDEVLDVLRPLRLDSIDLSETRVTGDALDRFRKQLPQCYVVGPGSE